MATSITKALPMTLIGSARRASESGIARMPRWPMELGTTRALGHGLRMGSMGVPQGRVNLAKVRMQAIFWGEMGIGILIGTRVMRVGVMGVIGSLELGVSIVDRMGYERRGTMVSLGSSIFLGLTPVSIGIRLWISSREKNN
jgi:hypothetical protein